MTCPRCKAGRCLVTATFAAGDTMKTQRRRCSNCGRTFTSVIINLTEGEGYGDGAYALAQRLLKNGPPKLPRM